MRALVWVAALASLAPCLAGGELAEALGRDSRLALAALPWLALLGLPVSGASAGQRRRRSWPAALGVAAPILALAAWLDLQNGIASARTVWTAGVAVLLAILLAEACHLARNRGAAWHPLVWLLLVPGTPALLAALGWVSTGAGTVFAPVRLLAEGSPLFWAWTRIPPGGAASEALPLAPLAAGLVLLALAALPPRAGREARP